MRTVDPLTWSSRLQKRFLRSSGLEQLTPEPHSEGLEARLRSSLRDASREYWDNCSLRGRTRGSDDRLSKLERWQRLAVWVAAVCWALVTVAVAGAALRDTPARLVRRREAQVPIHLVPFPAVAICSNNILVRDRLQYFTMLLSENLGNSNYSAAFLHRNLLQLAALLTLDLPLLDVDFMRFLRLVLPAFNVTLLTESLSPQCDQLLRRCSWRGKVLGCERLFAARLTPLGFCCVFNSRYSSVDVHRPPMYLDMVGQDYGLTALVYEDPDQFTRVRRASFGVDVLLFDGREYPLVEGGGVRLYPVQQDTLTFLTLRAATQRGAELRRGCDKRARGYAWCLTECRRRTVVALCGCHLHTLPPAGAGDDTPLCSLMDLPCLNKHREKLVYYYPYGYSTPALEEELQNGQQCGECTPDCARMLYSASVSVARYHHEMRRKHFKRHVAKGISLANSSIIRLFYTSKHQRLYLVKPTKRWYESFATLGSAWVGITGVTLVAAAELVFYHTVRWAHHFRRRTAKPPHPTP